MAKETSTVIKKILPYLSRIGYSYQDEMFFEEVVKKNDKVTGFTDIEIRVNKKLIFLIEAKRDSQKINDKHRKQALSYGEAKKVPFVVVTNGQNFEMWNVYNHKLIKINNESNIVPAKKDLPHILNALKEVPSRVDFTYTQVGVTTYTPGTTLKELTKIFKRCHDAIRDIERDDEHTFSDFSKFLFLKLLEEKAENEQLDPNGFQLPYTTRFSNIKDQEPDIIKSLVISMFTQMQNNDFYGEVLREDTFYIQNAKTFKKIVNELAEVNLNDSDVDVKGSAFEYFLKNNLKGSQLGQYFTPREVIRLMIEIVNLKSIVIGLTNPKNKYMVVDPACGSGGFLISGMNALLNQADKLYSEDALDSKTLKYVKERIKNEIFYGSDAKRMLVRTAKMNMIIAGGGRGFKNIKHGNSLTEEISFLKMSNRTEPEVDFILVNPPFGMSESDLETSELDAYDTYTKRGQALFLQKMIKITKPNGLICTVIDEGILNTQTMKDIRKYILKTCFIEAIISLPYVTFEPNFARVSTSILLLKKKKSEAMKQNYPIFMYDLKEIGYTKSGKKQGISSDEIIKDLVKKYKEFNDEYGK